MAGLVRVAFAMAVVLLAPGPVQATDYVSDAVAALTHAHVYVAPPDTNTTARLLRAVASDDGIVLVVLPPDALQGTTLDVLAATLSDRLGDRDIVGLAVGRDVSAVGATLPVGVATDLMRRASSVSNDSVTALVTFAQNVHVWQADHPASEPTLPPPAPDGFPIWLGAAAVIFVIILGIIAGWSSERRDKENALVRRFKVPGEIRDPLTHLAVEGERVGDLELRRAIAKMCTDIEAYFKWNGKDQNRIIPFFRDRIKEVLGIVDKYLRVQDSPEYHNDPGAIMELGKEAILDFAQYIVDEIRQGNDADIGAFKINAHTLEAYREMRFPEDIEAQGVRR